MAQQVALALESRDFTGLRALMGERFGFATWNTVLNFVSADEALTQLQNESLAQGSQPAVIWGTDVPPCSMGLIRWCSGDR